jgi:hypothetical protein
MLLIVAAHFGYHGVLLTVVSVGCIYLSIICLDVVGDKLQLAIFIKNALIFCGEYSLFELGAAIGLFIWGKNIKISYCKWINIASTTTLGIYLIHDNGNLRPVLWNKIFHVTEQLQLSPIIYFCYSLAVILIVFISCSIIELIRQHTIERIVSKILDKYMK